MSDTIPKPECEGGYPLDQLDNILGDRREEFNTWMYGQTMMICDGRSYDHDLHEYKPTGCGPHGPVAYSWDVERFLSGGPILD